MSTPFSFPTVPKANTMAPTAIHAPAMSQMPTGALTLEQALQGSTFTFADTISRPRLVIALEGMDGCGKTHFGLGAPSKRGLLYMGTDIGREGVAEKFEADLRARGRMFAKAEYALNIPNGASPTQIQDFAQAVWGVEARDFEIAVRSGASTIVMDTATEIWSHLVLARFGKLSEVPPNQWGIPASEYMGLIRQIFNSDTNLILLHKQKKEYKGKNATGAMIRAGFNDTNYLVQVSLLMSKISPGEVVDPIYYPNSVPIPGLEGKLVQMPATAAAGFGMPGMGGGITVNQKVFLGKVLKCRANTQLEGWTFVNPSFQMVAQAVMPNIDPAAWD